MKDTIDKLVDIDNQSRAIINKCEEKEENFNVGMYGSIGSNSTK